MKLNGKEKFSYGLGAVGKDMVYMLSASYVLYYYQDILGVSAVAMGVILLVARIFDAFNDPFMGVIENPLGKVPSVADDRNTFKCSDSVFDVCSAARIVRQRTCGLCGGILYPLGCHLYHDGYSVLVHDSGLYRKR